jgi:beta-galactosidase
MFHSGSRLLPIRVILASCLALSSLLALGVESSDVLHGSATAGVGRERLSMNFNWRFQLGDAPDAGTKFDYLEVTDLAKTRLDEIGIGGKLTADLPDPAEHNLGADVSFVKPAFDDSHWRTLDLPHDWAVELPFNTNADFKHGFKPVGPDFPQNSIGWYRREFELPALDRGKTLWVEFDGVYRDSLVWLNGHCLGRNVSGYGSFRYDISEFANCGGKNELVVRVDASRFEGWFYEGAGIYRDVWLVKTPPLAVAPDGVFVYSQFADNVPSGDGTIRIQTQLFNSQSNSVDPTVWCEIFSPDGKSLVRFGKRASMVGWSKHTVEQSAVFGPDSALSPDSAFVTHVPILWSPESPKLYKLVTTIENDGHVVDRKETEFGIRTVAFDAQQGFLLNGKPYVIKGTCNHQDHAGVGSAMPDALQYFRVRKLKEMGSNAIRTSHNPPTPALLEACDRLGMLVMDENRRVDTTDLVLEDLRRMVLRDRNHPGVFVWSLGNEEGQLQGTNAAAHEAAKQVLTPMQKLVHELDPTRLCTMAMNGGWGEGLTQVIDVQGFNYRTRNINNFRAKFPTKLTIGTETASTRTTRGIYADDRERGYVAAYGENGIERPWTWWSFYAAHPFTSGGFVWTGFDYRGEPTPYKWPCISSHFGLMDTCGFPKDIYYYYQAWWTDRPMLHLATDWNWPGMAGKTNLVRCFSNCKTVELFLNGKSLGKQNMHANEYLDWQVPGTPGQLSARGYNGKKFAVETKLETIGAPTAIQLHPDRSSITADGEDVSVIDVSVEDAHGRVAVNAGNLIRFELKGPGKIIGVGNGDPSSHEPDKASQRKVFNGFAQVIVQADRQRGTIELTATSAGLHSANVKIKTAADKSVLAVVP